MNESFFKFMRHKMPFIVLKCAQSLDGKIATATGSSKWITSAKTRAFSHRLRDQFDAILVGINTVVKDDPFLNGSSKQKKLKKIILDPNLRLSLRANLFKDTLPSDVIVATMLRADQQKIRQFEKKGVNVICCPTIANGLDLKWFLKKLAQKEITSILVEGGSKTAGRILSQSLTDKVWIFMAPKIVGDQQALSAYDGLNTKDINKALKLKKVNIQHLGEDIFVEGYLK
jgi:diaminohydroxyphosphoribosylaminopyrimidine deaminase/5-amino-6-(5-phosphoribosylamino)uracil reductase